MILAIDTCGAVGGVALAHDSAASDFVAHYRELAGKTFSERLIGTISELLAEANSTPSHLSEIVVIHGPGSFTGIRIGVSAAKGLSEVLGLPLVAVSRLELLARKASLPASIAMLDAGRGEFFAGVYRRTNDSECAREMEVLLSREQAISLAADLCLPVAVCEEQVCAALGLPPSHLLPAPTAVDALVAGAARMRRSDFDDAANLDANYLRRSETEMLARIAEHAAIRATEAQVRE